MKFDERNKGPAVTDYFRSFGKQLFNGFGALGLGHLSTGSSSMFNKNLDETQEGQISPEMKYANVKSWGPNDKIIEKLLSPYKQPQNIKFLDCAKEYNDKRNAIFKAAGVEQKDYNSAKIDRKIEGFEAFREEIASVPQFTSIGCFAFATELSTQKADTYKALDEQYKSDVDAIEKLAKFKDPAQEEAKKKLLADLKANHDKEYANAKAILEEATKKAYYNARFENDRLSLILLYNQYGDKALLQTMAQLAAENNTDVFNAIVEGKDINPLQNIDAKRLQQNVQTFRTYSGSTITQQDGAYHIQFPSRAFSPFYHNALQNNVAADLQLLAKHVKAGGYQKISFTFSNTTDDSFQLYAREAIRQAMKEGFEVGNGKLAPKDLSTESKEDKAARLGDITIKTASGEIIPLISEKNAEGRVIKQGVYDDPAALQSDIDDYQKKFQAIIKDSENDDAWKYIREAQKNIKQQTATVREHAQEQEQAQAQAENKDEEEDDGLTVTGESRTLKAG